MPVKIKIMYLNSDKFDSCFLMAFDIKLKSTYIMSIFLILWKNIPVFLNLLSFSVLVMYVSMERLYAAKFASAFFPSSLFAILQSMNRFLFRSLAE